MASFTAQGAISVRARRLQLDDVNWISTQLQNIEQFAALIDSSILHMVESRSEWSELMRTWQLIYQTILSNKGLTLIMLNWMMFKDV